MRIVTILLCISTLIACETASPSTKDTPPNIVLIMTDDQGYGDLSFHGNDSIATPNIDQFAKESVQLDRFYVSQVCAPTRASLLTGRYHPRTGTTGVTGRREVMRASETTLAEILKANGYATGIFGKWHNGAQYPNDPNGQGFDEFVGFCAGHWNNYFDTKLQHNQKTIQSEGYLTDFLTDKAIQFIEKNATQPFFCYIPYNTPHSPMQVADKYFDKYKAMGLTDFNAAAYGMVENIDDNVGKILNSLASLGLDNNTIVIFTTDNGPNGNRFNGNMKGRKGSYDEGGVRVPFFLRYPNGNLAKGQAMTELTAHIDLLPTLSDLCGITLPDSLELDGKNITPLLKGANQNWEDRSIYSFRHGAPFTPHPGAVRTPTHRWVLQRDSSIALYDMQKDPAQKQNIAADYPEIVASIGAAYAQKIQEVTTNSVLVPPIPVGYKNASTVSMPATDAILAGDIGFKEGHGWANDWLINWSTTKDQATWQIEVVDAGTFQVNLTYNATPSSLNSLVVVSNGEASISTTLTQPFESNYFDSPDRVKRKEVYEKEWATLEVGQLYLEQGLHELKVRAEQVQGDEVMELKSMVLERVE